MPIRRWEHSSFLFGYVCWWGVEQGKQRGVPKLPHRRLYLRCADLGTGNEGKPERLGWLAAKVSKVSSLVPGECP